MPENRKPLDLVYKECSDEVFSFLEFHPEMGPFVHFPPLIDDAALKRRVSWEWWDNDLRYGFVRYWIDWVPPSETWVRRDLSYSISQLLMPWKTYAGWLRKIWTANDGKEEDFLRALPKGLLERAQESVSIANNAELYADSPDEQDIHRDMWIREARTEINQLETLIAALQVGITEIEKQLETLKES
jgi:hypothetical protein